MLYFAYGSNMLRSRLEVRLGPVNDLGIALFNNHAISFNKYSTVDQSGKTNVVEQEGSEVIGILFDLTTQQFETLNGNEGGYMQKTIPVNHNGKVIHAETYIAANTRNNLRPTRGYRQYLIDGAREHNFPENYITMLEAVEVQD